MKPTDTATPVDGNPTPSATTGSPLSPKKRVGTAKLTTLSQRGGPEGRKLAAFLKLTNAQAARHEAAQALATTQKRIGAQVETLQRQRDAIDSEIDAANSEIGDARAALARAEAAVTEAQAALDALGD